MKSKIAIVGFVALLATLLTAAPVAAGHTTTVLSNGTLLVRGNNGDNSVAACQTGPTTWLVAHFGRPLANIETFVGVTTDVKFDMRGGDDFVGIGCFSLFGLTAAEIAPRDIIVLMGSGDDYVFVRDVGAEDDINVQLGSGDSDQFDAVGVGVGGDFLVRGQGGFDTIGIRDAIVGDRTDINTGPGESEVSFADSSTGRTQIIGGSSDDFITVDGSDMGEVPRIVTGNGDDLILANSVAATTRLLIKAGSGDDLVDVNPVGPAFMFNINLVAGDDMLFIDDDVRAGDLINCGAGTDSFGLSGSDGGATIRNC